MLKLYRIRDARTGKVYSVQADSFQGACEKAGIPPADATLLSAPKPVGTPCTLIYPHNGGQYVCKEFPSHHDAYLYVLQELLQVGLCIDAIHWLNLLDEILGDARERGLLEEGGERHAVPTV